MRETRKLRRYSEEKSENFIERSQNNFHALRRAHFSFSFWRPLSKLPPSTSGWIRPCSKVYKIREMQLHNQGSAEANWILGWSPPRLMKMSPLYPCSKPYSRGTHNETVKYLAIFSSIINRIMIESRLRISIPWEYFQFFDRVENSITFTP